MKHTTLLILFIITSLFLSAQEEESVLSAPEGWKSEIIPFPLGFAQEIEFNGFEELRFAPQWTDSTSLQFWTYMFVWYIETGPAMTEQILTENFNLYYDGLMGVDESQKSEDPKVTKLDKTQCSFVQTDDGFSGNMRVWDRFFTKKYISLNIKVSETFCPSSNKQVVRCDISPQSFDHKVWKLFEQVILIKPCN